MESGIKKKFVFQIFSFFLIRLSFMAVMIFGIFIISNPMQQQPYALKSNNLQSVNIAARQPSKQNATLKKAKTNLNPTCVEEVECILHPIILKAASRHQIDPALIKAIIMAESGYKIKAISKRGAKGLMQLMPATAQALGVEDSFNPKQNISGGVRYFKQLVTQFDGDVKLALAAYNAGSRNVRHYQGIPPFKATRFYIKKVLKYYAIYKNQMACTKNDMVFSNNSNHYS